LRSSESLSMTVDPVGDEGAAGAGLGVS